MTGLSALLVDDDEFVRTTVARQLESVGAGRVETAADGAGALRAMLAHGPFDLIVADLMLPGIDGIEFLRDLAARQPQAALVLISALDETVLRAAAVLARQRGLRPLGALRKPIRQDALAALLGARTRATGEAGDRPVDDADPAALLRAIEHNAIEIRLLPRVGSADPGLTGVEARLHWIATASGMEYTHTGLLALAERRGLAGRMTEHLLALTLQAAADCWRNELRMPISVSLPASALQRLDLPDLVDRQLRANGVLPQLLRIGFTEPALTDSDAVLDVLTRLRMRDIGVCVDDFGSGRSSFLQMQRIPATQARVDARLLLLRGTGGRLLDHALHTAIELQLETIADGVVSEEHCAYLARAGCAQVQGPIVSPALSVHALRDWQQSRRHDPAKPAEVA